MNLRIFHLVFPIQIPFHQPLNKTISIFKLISYLAAMSVWFLKDQHLSAHNPALSAAYTKIVPHKDMMMHVSQHSTRDPLKTRLHVSCCEVLSHSCVYTTDLEDDKLDCL